MYLQVPVKLERYIDDIKRQTNKFVDEKKLTLLQIGKSKSGETYKIMMLMYNPYSNPIHITPNLFASDSSIYKMYPNEFKIGADTISAFVLFTTKDVTISINEQELLSSIKSDIENMLLRLEKNDNDNQIEVHQVFKIDPSHFEADQTMVLEHSNLNIDEIDSVKFTNNDEQYINVEFIQISDNEKNTAIEIQVTNTDSKRNIEISGINLKIADGTRKMHIATNQKMLIKASSSKKMRIYVNKLEFSLIEQEKMEMKATIL